jgi:hypothetical protein
METLIYVGFSAFLLHVLYQFTREYLEYRVSRASTEARLTFDLMILQADIALGHRHGCKPPPELPKRWPLGIDRIKELWDSDAEGRLLAFLCAVAKDYEPRNNLSQYLLIGPRAFHVLHPKNVENVLSTNFNGEELQKALEYENLLKLPHRLRLRCTTRRFRPVVG